MRSITLTWETWRAIIAVLRAKGLPSMLEHAALLELQLEQHEPDQAMASLDLTPGSWQRCLPRCRRGVALALLTSSDR
jgi:hypothetical protein